MADKQFQLQFAKPDRESPSAHVRIANTIRLADVVMLIDSFGLHLYQHQNHPPCAGGGVEETSSCQASLLDTAKPQMLVEGT
ncbi:unnamed protein product [Dibothriocephalus latus]|uniref:Uncharacterized protein n=1 Tax=Dibothriocephalus latus TaxID=60516 RepID=A0A3P7LQW2_DIBLA|nr:unnamed protein product [Dibothriocephalus latus]